MRNGLRVYDSDTHVLPAAEVLERYVDPEFRPRLAELTPFRVLTRAANEESGGLHNYRVATKYYRRILGEAEPRETHSGRESNWRGGRQPRPPRQANAADMDDEGADVHFLIPTSWVSLCGLDDPTIEQNMIRAYHRHMADFCGQHPTRLKGLIRASARDVEGAVREIREWGQSNWAVAVQPSLGLDLPVDHPDLEPIWRAAADHGLPIIHHSSTWNPPYYPGCDDMWDNIFLGRMASHPWGAMRFAAAFIGAGIYDRYPDLRMGVLECGFGWLPFWGRRMDEQYRYVGSTAALKRLPSEYLSSGRFFCSIERQEGEDMFHTVTSFLGDDVLMYASDYPHSECQFPNSIDNILAWQSLTGEQRGKLLWDNAARFFKDA
jgi:predicted TIM-barrel fold metal-dependent hydrolase